MRRRGGWRGKGRGGRGKGRGEGGGGTGEGEGKVYTRPSFSQGGVTSCAGIFKQSMDMEAIGTEHRNRVIESFPPGYIGWRN